jgi:hypothetical protein
MVYTIIRGQTAVASILVATLEYNRIVQRVRIRSTLPQTDATTFSTEQNGQFIAGIERMTFDMTALMTKGDTRTGPFLPLAAFQGVAVSVAYDTGCSIASVCNAQDGGADRAAGQLGNVDVQFITTGTIVVTWSNAAAT